MCSSLLTSLWRETVDLEEERYLGMCLNWTFNSTGSAAIYWCTGTKHTMFTWLYNVSFFTSHKIQANITHNKEYPN